MSNNYQKPRTKKLKNKNVLKTNSGAPFRKINIPDNSLECSPRRYSLLAKDSEWIDMLGSVPSNSLSITDECNTPSGEQIARPEDDSQTHALTRMFPNLLQDPRTLEGIVNKTMSTTEITKHLIGHKAHFESLKKVDRLIPPDKEWLSRLTENSNSYESIEGPIPNEKCGSSCCAGKTFDRKSMATISKVCNKKCSQENKNVSSQIAK